MPQEGGIYTLRTADTPYAETGKNNAEDMGSVNFFMHDVIKMADNIGVENGSHQPQNEGEAINLTDDGTPVDAIAPSASLNSTEDTGSPSVTPTQPPQDPPANPEQDSVLLDFSEPEHPAQTDATPLLVVTGETASSNDTTSTGQDSLKPEIQAESHIAQGDSSEGSSVVSENAKVKDEGSLGQSSQPTSDNNGDSSRQDSGSTEGSRGDGPPTRSRAQPVLDASKLKERESKNNQYRQQQLNDRQKRIEDLRSKGNDHRAEILERKKKQEQEDQARKEAIVRRSRERSDNAREKRRSWSAFGSRDRSSPIPSSGSPRTPRGRSTDRMTERQSYGGVLPLGTSKRLSSSVSSLHKPVHLVRLGPNENDWFEVHVPDPLSRRGSSPGNDKQTDSSSPLPDSSSATPRHHLSSPNLASAYPHRDSRSAHSTPTHVSRPISGSKRSNSNSKLDDGSGQDSRTPAPGSAPAKRAPSPRTGHPGRPPSPRQQPSAPRSTPVRVPSPKTIGSQGSTTVDGSKTKPARAPSPRSLPKQTNGDSRKPQEAKKTPAQAPPIKKALTPRTDIGKSTVSSPTRTTPKTTPKAPTAKPATTPKGIPKQAKPAAVKAAAVPEKPAEVKDEGEKEKVEQKETAPKEAKPKEPQRSLSPTASESSTGSAPSSNGTAPAAQAPPKELTDEERAKQALAERRRQAREKAEREAELEKQRQEQLKREEEERIRREEEERIRLEEEEMRLAEEHRKAEEERLKRIMEENEEREKLEAERRAAEEAEAAQRAEEEKIRQEELKRQEAELAEKCRKEEEERDARKKRVEEIMKRARRGAQAKDKDEPSEDGDSGSESGSGSGSERKTNGVNSILASSSLLSSEKYRNLLFNRNKSQLSGEEDDDDDDDEGGQVVEGDTNGKAVTSSSDSEDRDMSEEGAKPKDALLPDKPEWSAEYEAGPTDKKDDAQGDEKEVMDEDEMPDQPKEVKPDWSDDREVSEEGRELKGALEEQPGSCEESSDSFGGGIDAGAVMGVAEEEKGVVKEEVVPVDPPINGNGNMDGNNHEDSSDAEQSEHLSENGNEVEPQGAFTPPVYNVPASDDFNNANGENLIEPIMGETELITKKPLLDFGDGGGTLDEGGTIEVGEELSPDSANDKLNANLDMRAGFPSGDASMTLSFSPLDELGSNGEQQQQPMVVQVTPEDAV